MKLTSKKLKQIIKEEMKKLQEGGGDFPHDSELSHMGTVHAAPGLDKPLPAPDESEMASDDLEGLIELAMDAGLSREEAILDLQQQLEDKKTGM